MARPDELIREGIASLANTPSAMVDARLLLAHVLDVAPSSVLLASDIGPDQVDAFRTLIDRRRAGVPLQHLTGEVGFRYETVSVGPGVFIPRPETELMAGWAIDAVRGVRAPVVVELCAGSGAISLAIAHEVPNASVWAVEIDGEAVRWAARNLEDSGVRLVHGDMASALSDLDGQVDCVIANPPYVPEGFAASLPPEVHRDPPQAVFSGPTGLDAITVVSAVSARLLRPGGVVACEHDDTQGTSAPDVFVRTGAFRDIIDHRDLTDRPRFVTARRS